MLKAMLLIGMGGAIGSIVRWLLSSYLNALFPLLPPGTLAANLIAGYLIGVCIAIFLLFPSIPPEWRLFLITGCLGGVSTFSTFSAEIATLIQQQKMIWACLAISAHVIGSVSLTLLGMLSVQLIRVCLKF